MVLRSSVQTVQATLLKARSLLLPGAALILFSAAAPSLADATAPSATPNEADAPVMNLTAEQWREDLRFLVSEMKRRHANLYHSASREQFDAAVAELDSRIPALERNEIIVEMMRLAAMVGDGHTRIDPRWDLKFGFPSLPLRLYLFEDGLYIRAAAPKFASLVGAKVVEIGGVPVEETIRRVNRISSVDNSSGLKLFAPLYLNRPDILNALKLSPRHDEATFKLSKSDQTWTVTVPAGEVEPVWPDDTDASFITPEGWVDARINTQPPLWLQAPLELHRMVELPEQKLLYAQLNMVAGTKEESLAAFGERIYQAAKTKSPEKIVIDLRLNYGGNWDLRSGFIRELIKGEDTNTKMFVLTARGSFSATEAILVDLKRLTHAVFVGEPASSKPNHYGDGYREVMPNSGISFQTSIYWNQLANASNKDPWTFIDVAEPLTFADYAAGRDPALEAVLNYTPPSLLIDRLSDAASKGGSSAVVEAAAAFEREPRNRYLNLGVIIPQTAERLWLSKHSEEALALASYAAKRYPESVDAAIVLTYVALKTEHFELALEAAQQTLKLDPNHRGARDYLAVAKAKLGVK